MKRTIISGLVAGLAAGVLLACGGGSQDSRTSSSQLLADGEACSAAWSASTWYTGGVKVSRNGRNYTSAYATQNQDPVTNSGPAGSGYPWVTGYLCGSAPAPAPTPTPTPAPAPAPTPTPTPAPAPAPTPTPAPQPTTDCPQWIAGKAFATGSKAFNKGGYFLCKVGGWCSSSPSAFEPGVGWAWTDAWSSIAASQCTGTPVPTPAPAPAPAPTPTPTPTPTSSCPQWVLGKKYIAGAKVTNKGGYYQCKVEGWCSSTASAYEPGVGWAWGEAWAAITASQCTAP